MINPTVHLRICLSTHQRDCLFFPPIEHPPPLFTGILLLIEFPRWNFIPDTALFFSLPFPLIVLSRETISQTSFLAGFLSARLTHRVPFRPTPLSLSFFSDNTFMHTQGSWIKRRWTKSWAKKRDTLFPKRIEHAQQSSFHLEARPTCVECNRAASWRIHPQRRLFAPQRRNTRDSWRETLHLAFTADLCRLLCEWNDESVRTFS